MPCRSTVCSNFGSFLWSAVMLPLSVGKYVFNHPGRVMLMVLAIQNTIPTVGAVETKSDYLLLLKSEMCAVSTFVSAPYWECAPEDKTVTIEELEQLRSLKDSSSATMYYYKNLQSTLLLGESDSIKKMLAVAYQMADRVMILKQDSLDWSKVDVDDFFRGDMSLNAMRGLFQLIFSERGRGMNSQRTMRWLISCMTSASRENMLFKWLEMFGSGLRSFAWQMIIVLRQSTSAYRSKHVKLVTRILDMLDVREDLLESYFSKLLLMALEDKDARSVEHLLKHPRVIFPFDAEAGMLINMNDKAVTDLMFKKFQDLMFDESMTKNVIDDRTQAALAVMPRLLETGRHVEVVETILYRAVSEDRFQVVDEFIYFGLEPNFRIGQETLLSVALRYGHSALVSMLVDEYRERNILLNEQETLLKMALRTALRTESSHQFSKVNFIDMLDLFWHYIMGQKKILFAAITLIIPVIYFLYRTCKNRARVASVLEEIKEHPFIEELKEILKHIKFKEDGVTLNVSEALEKAITAAVGTSNYRDPLTWGTLFPIPVLLPDGGTYSMSHALVEYFRGSHSRSLYHDQPLDFSLDNRPYVRVDLSVMSIMFLEVSAFIKNSTLIDEQKIILLAELQTLKPKEYKLFNKNSDCFKNPETKKVMKAPFIDKYGRSHDIKRADSKESPVIVKVKGKEGVFFRNFLLGKWCNVYRKKVETLAGDGNNDRLAVLSSEIKS